MNQILKQSHGFQVNEASDIIDYVLLAKQIKLRYSASMFRFFDTSFEASVSNVTYILYYITIFDNAALWKCLNMLIKPAFI